jgi:hypothetical protein
MLFRQLVSGGLRDVYRCAVSRYSPRPVRYPRLVQGGPDIRTDLGLLERHMLDGDKRATATLCGVLLERLLKVRTMGVLASGTAEQRARVQDALGDTAVDRAALGRLLRALERDKLLQQPQRKRGLWAVRGARNWAAHDSADEPSALVVDGCAEAIWELVAALEMPEAGERQAIRDAARTRHDTAPRRTALAPPTILNRQQQRAVVVDRLQQADRALLTVVHGEHDQGHSHLADFCLAAARSRQARAWVRLPAVRWPSGALPGAQRLPMLLESCSAAVAPGVAYIGQAQLVAVVVGRLQRGEALFVRHEVVDPDVRDAELVAAYLDALWTPVLEQVGELSAVLTIEAHVPLSSGWYFSDARRAAKRARRGVHALTTALQAHGAGLQVAVLPELGSLSIDEIFYYLPEALRRRLGPDEARAYARDVHAKSASGRFERVCALLQ